MFSAQSEMLTALRFAPKQRDETDFKAPPEPEAAGLGGFGGRGSLTLAVLHEHCRPLSPGSSSAQGGVHVSLLAERSAGSSALGEGPPGVPAAAHGFGQQLAKQTGWRSAVPGCSGSCDYTRLKRSFLTLLAASRVMPFLVSLSWAQTPPSCCVLTWGWGGPGPFLSHHRALSRLV